MLSEREVNTLPENEARRDDTTPDKNLKSKTSKSTRKRKRRRSSTDEDEFDTSIDVKLKQSAVRNNLTPQNVKNILQKVVRNDHVLAIVKLKEEELVRREQAMKDSMANNETSIAEMTVPENDENNELENAIPKLTRAKARALNQYPLPVAPLKHSEPASEVIALIREELHSDDDDEEYQPGEDDIESDDEVNTTVSDIDSQPATPSSQVDAYEEIQAAVYTQDGLFKIPRLRNDSTTSQSEQEYIIAQRTRSKISLAETPIEAIESTFKPPDVSMDMYQMEQDEDPNWIQFLNNYANPSTLEIEKDEDTDPDYCPKIVDSQPVDREEFQLHNVSKKEYNDLLNDCFNLIDPNLLDLNFFDTLTLDTNSSKYPATTTDELNESLVTPVKVDSMAVKQIDGPLTTEPIKDQKETVTQVQAESPISSNVISYFDPCVISTPAKPNYNNNNTISTIHQTQQQSFDSFNSTLNCTSYSHPYSFTSLQEKSPVFVPVMTFTTNSNAPHNHVALPYNSILVTIPPEATATTPAMPPTVISSIQANNSSNQMQYLNQQIQAGPISKRPGCRAKRSRFKSAAYRELENLDPNSIKPKIHFSANERGFTNEQHLILESQLRIHVQLSTQSYIQTYGHPELYSEANRFKRFLIELNDIVHKDTSVSVYNLKPAMELIASWENELSQNTTENTEFFTYLQEEINKLRKNLGYTMHFHERILRLICESKVFIYPELLPAIPFRFKTTKLSEYFPAEDYLLAFLLEHFFDELRRKSISYRFAKPKEVTLTSVSHHISAHLNYLRHWKSIYDYIRLRRDCDLMNPIKYYFKHQRAPPIRYRYEVFNQNLIIEPAKQPLNVLSTQWARYVEKLIGFRYDEVLQKIVSPSSVLSPLDNEKKTEKNTSIKKISNKNSCTVKNVNNDDNNCSIEVKILYEHRDNNNLPIHKELEVGASNSYDPNDIYTNDHSERLCKGQTLLTSYFHPVQRTFHDFNDDGLDFSIGVEAKENRESAINNIVATEKKHILRHSLLIRKKYRKLNIYKYLVCQRSTQFLVHLIIKVRKQFSPHWHRFKQNRNISFVYRCIITYHLFATEFIRHRKHKIPKFAAKMNTEALITNRRVQKFSSDSAISHVREMTEENAAIHSVQQSDVGAKRLPKNQRTSDNARLLLLSDNAQESSEKDFLFAQRFMDRVEETFINENKHHKFTEFLSILRKFSENQQQQTGADLYLTLEKFLMPDYPELMELFLSFLLPSDAIEINKSMDYFLKVNSTKFLNKLSIFFQKQPAQIRKVLACLKELSEDPDVTIDRIRSKVLPLLKGNQLLIDWFLQCVAPDKCESSKDEYETLVLRKGNESFDDDQFEYIPQSEIAVDPNENPCHIRYMNGRLFYGNRFPLPAKLSFSAMPCSSASIDTLETEKQLLMSSGDKHLHYHCVHNIKEFADSKMRDRHHSELEHIENSNTPEDIENSDDEQHFSVPVDKVDDGESANASGDHVLCDNSLLRAHSIRLNPSLHTPLIHSNIDILNRLKPPDQSSGDATTTKELRLSPKKQAATKNSTNVLTKSSQVRKNNSPNAKKAAISGSKSPNNKKTVSPLLSGMQNIDSGSTLQTVQHESNAIQTAKKLKRILETNDQAYCLPNLSDDASKRANVVATSNKIKSHKSHMHSKPIKKQKRAHEYCDSGDEEDKVEEFVEKDESKLQSDTDSHKRNTPLEIQWTREEDRLLLEQIKAGIDSNVENITGFADRFPNKTQDQIRDRIDFLIDFLTKLRNKHN